MVEKANPRRIILDMPPDCEFPSQYKLQRSMASWY